MNWIDLISIVPFYMQRILHNFGTDLRFIRAARLARITSSLKTMRFGNMNKLIGDIVNNSVAALIIPLYLMSLSAIVFGAFMYQLEGGTLYCCAFDGSGHIVDTCQIWTKSAGFEYGDCGAVGKPKYRSIMLTHELGAADAGFESIPDGIWWCFVTFTTVGYGDISPSTGYGKFLNVCAMFLGVFFFAMPVAIIGDSFVYAWKNKKMKDNASTARRLLISGQWKPNLQRLGEIRQDMDAHAYAMKDTIKTFRDSRPEVEQVAWDSLTHALTVFKSDFETVWGYYNIDVEQLRLEMQHKLEELQKLERSNTPQSPADFKIANPLHDLALDEADDQTVEFSSDSDGTPLSPPASSTTKVKNPMLRDSVRTTASTQMVME